MHPFFWILDFFFPFEEDPISISHFVHEAIAPLPNKLSRTWPAVARYSA